MSYGETLAQLEKKYSNLQDQLFCTMDRSQIELAKAKGKLTLAQKNLKQSYSQAAYFRKRCESATTLRWKAVIQAKKKLINRPFIKNLHIHFYTRVFTLRELGILFTYLSNLAVQRNMSVQ
jgi:hypothetical protein